MGFFGFVWIVDDVIDYGYVYWYQQVFQVFFQFVYGFYYVEVLL